MENPNNEAKLFAMYAGVVVDRADPKKLGRVKARIPAIAEPSTGWCWPMGGAGGGGTRRGGKATPPLKAEVSVFFLLGDMDRPYFIPGNWGILEDGTHEAPGGGRQVPVGRDLDEEGNLPQGDEATPEQAADIDVYETANWLLAIDEQMVGENRKGSLFIRNKATGDVIEYDGVAKAWLIQGSTAIDIKCDGILNLDANQIQINGRIVRNVDDPI